VRDASHRRRIRSRTDGILPKSTINCCRQGMKGATQGISKEGMVRTFNPLGDRQLARLLQGSTGTEYKSANIDSISNEDCLVQTSPPYAG
jgi:hypothetical protein